MSAQFGKGLYRRLRLRDAEDDTVPLDPIYGSAGKPRVVREQEQGDDERRHEPFPARAKDSNEGSIKVLRDDEVAVEDHGRKALSLLDVGLDELLAEPPKHRNNQADALSNRTIMAITAAVVVIGFAFTAFLPSLLTRRATDSTVIPITSAAPNPPVQTEVLATQPLPDPGPAAELPEAALPAPASNAVAESTPVLRGTGIVPEKQTSPRATRVEALTPRAGKDVATSRVVLTTAEQAAVSRGLQELERAGVIEAPRRPAPSRSSLTDAEKAAVERGLQELNKAAGSARP